MTDRGGRMSPQDISELAAAWRPGSSLDSRFYRSEAIYRRDLSEVFYRHWVYAGHVSQAPDAGSYFLADVGEESVIVVRG